MGMCRAVLRYFGVIEGGVARHGAGRDHEPIGAAHGTPLHVVDRTLLALNNNQTR